MGSITGHSAELNLQAPSHPWLKAPTLSHLMSIYTTGATSITKTLPSLLENSRAFRGYLPGVKVRAKFITTQRKKT